MNCLKHSREFEILVSRGFSFYLGLEGFHVKIVLSFYVCSLSLSFNSAKTLQKRLNLSNNNSHPRLVISNRFYIINYINKKCITQNIHFNIVHCSSKPNNYKSLPLLKLRSIAKTFYVILQSSNQPIARPLSTHQELRPPYTHYTYQTYFTKWDFKSIYFKN